MTGKQLIQGCSAVALVGVERTAFEIRSKTFSTEPRHTAKCDYFEVILKEDFVFLWRNTVRRSALCDDLRTPASFVVHHKVSGSNISRRV